MGRNILGDYLIKSILSYKKLNNVSHTTSYVKISFKYDEQINERVIVEVELKSSSNFGILPLRIDSKDTDELYQL